jgi:hypothetical protein
MDAHRGFVGGEGVDPLGRIGRQPGDGDFLERPVAVTLIDPGVLVAGGLLSALVSLRCLLVPKRALDLFGRVVRVAKTHRVRDAATFEFITLDNVDTFLTGVVLAGGC